MEEETEQPQVVIQNNEETPPEQAPPVIVSQTVVQEAPAQEEVQEAGDNVVSEFLSRLEELNGRVTGCENAIGGLAGRLDGIEQQPIAAEPIPEETPSPEKEPESSHPWFRKLG